MDKFYSYLQRLFVVALLFAHFSAQATTYYVRMYDGEFYIKQGDGTFAVGDDAYAEAAARAATSWEDAIADLQAVINVANAGDIIFVAEGIYKPVRAWDSSTSTLGLINNGKDRDNAFVLKTGVQIYGGFAGTEASLGDRKLSVYETILSGELQDDGTNTNNAKHVVVAAAVNDTRLDGFSITGGYADYGGGIYGKNASITLNYLTIKGNAAINYGGGIYADNNASITLSNSVVSGNTAENGGGVYNNSGTINLTNVTIAGNHANNDGGGLFNYGSSTFYNSIVWGNTSGNASPNVHSSYNQYHSLIEGMSNTADGNLDGTNSANNPQFNQLVHALPGKPTVDGDYHLAVKNPVVDRGNNGFNTVSTDLDGNARIQGCSVDLGAYEGISDIVTNSQGIVFVKKGATGDGSSWNNAYPELADVLLRAKMAPGCITEIWVAEGTFYPMYDTYNSTDPRNKSFELVSNVKIYGGFVGNEDNVDGRKFVFVNGVETAAHETILSGELQGDGIKTNNAQRVVYAQFVNNALLDGFTITGGYSDNHGGGMLTYQSSLKLVHLNIRNNFAAGSGGGLNDDGGTDLEFYNSIITGNHSGSYGGGIWLKSTDATQLINLLVSGNEAAIEGGGIYNVDGNANTLFANLTVAGNKAGANTGGIYSTGSVSLKNSIVWGNSGQAIEGAAFNNFNNLIQGSGGSANWNTNFGIDNGKNIDTDPLFVNPSDAISAPTILGDYRLQACSPAIDAGDDDFIPAEINTDLDCKLRNDGIIDMGAYEFYTASKAKRPTATPLVSGTVNIMLGEGIDLFALTGVSPWEITYQYTDSKGDSQIGDLSGIQTSPYRFVPAKSGEYDFTLLSVENATCKTEIFGADKIIVIVNGVVESPDLTAAIAVNPTQIIQTGQNFALTPTADFSGTDVTPSSVFRVHLINGVDILGVDGDTISRVANTDYPTQIAGKATYSITPYYYDTTGDVFSGAPVLMLLEARDVLNIDDYIKLNNKEFTYANGDYVPTIKLNSNPLPEGVVVTWTSTNTTPTIGVGTAGDAEIPGFRAVYTDGGMTNSEIIKYTISYVDGNNVGSVNLSGTVTITVRYKIVEDLDLETTATIITGTACVGSPFEFNLETTYRNVAVTPTSYHVELLSGTDILTAGYTFINGTNQPLANKAGNAIYRITPVYNSKQGLPAIVSLEAHAIFDIDKYIPLDGVTFNYQHGDAAPTIKLNANPLPEGFVVSWNRSGSTSTGVAVGGGAEVPGFTAVFVAGGNNKATITYTVEYLDGSICGTGVVSGSFDIVIADKPDSGSGGNGGGTAPTVDPDLVAQITLNTGIACVGNPFNFNLETSYQNNPLMNPFEYRVELIDGVDVLSNYTFQNGANRPTAKIAGSAIYHITPVYNGMPGIPVSLSLIAYPVLDASDYIQLDGKTFSYANGDQAPTLKLNSNPLPVGAVVTWTSDNTSIGVAAAGDAEVPGFRAIYTDGGNNTAVIHYTVVYPGSPCNTGAISGSFTIKITPRTNIDLDLVAYTDADASNIVCLGETFNKITFSATDKLGHAGKVEYRIELVSGVNVAGSIPAASTATTWIPKGNVAGTGVYRVVPIVNGREGVAALFSLEARARLVANQVSDLIYQNGDRVPAIRFENLSNTVVTWTANNPNEIGISAKGTGEIPAFTAFNPGASNVKTTINYTVAYLDGKGCEANGSFTITVTPKTVDNADLYIVPIENQTVCYGTAFADIHLMAAYRFNHEYAEATDFRWELMDGTDILGIGTMGLIQSPDNHALWTISDSPIIVGYASYRITPFRNNSKGASITFTLTRLPQMNIDNSEIVELVYCIDDIIRLDTEIEGGNPTYQWYKNDVEIAGATEAVYTIPSDYEGNYYALITTECGISKSKNYHLTANPNLVVQRWDDVLILKTNFTENGGFNFVGYQWYAINNGLETKLFGQNISYLYISDKSNTATTYFVRAVTADGQIYQSCPVALQSTQSVEIKIYPNPVRRGEFVTVDIPADFYEPDQTIIQVFNVTNSLVSKTNATGTKTLVKMPNTTGIYVMRVVTGDNTKSFKIIVE
jgi:hypothetical protein